MQWLEGYNNSTHFVYWRNKLILVTLERTSTRSSRSEVFLKISLNLQENTCASVSFLNKVAGLRPMIFMKKEALAQVFSCEFWEIFKNTYLYRTPLVAASKVGLTDYVKKKNALKMILLKDLSSLEEYIYNKLCICIIKVSIQKNNFSSSKYI